MAGTLPAEPHISRGAVEPARLALDAARRKPGTGRVRWVEGAAEVLPQRSFEAVLMTGHVAQFFISDEQWLSTLRLLRRSLVAGGRLIFDSRDPPGPGVGALGSRRLTSVRRAAGR
ncbi:class I SAM-dependent methyltransferase [Paractinoplanes maris]|uniref:class I SAM-dependent methyltransferase n=1 Tax=Paractinoplanes maris TaxID=1734446 RepID=UPI00201FDA01|nr:class I SAM-dependent methyltransferase [Actinoplanes maris]